MSSLKSNELRVKEVFDRHEADPTKPIGEVMLEANYSKSYSKSPHQFKNTAVAKAEYKRRFPDSLLNKVHKQGLKATTKKPHLIDRDDKGRPIYDYIDEVDHSTRHKFLDSAYKLRGDYAPEKHEGVLVHTPLSEYLDAIQNGTVEGQKFIKPEPKNAEPITKEDI